METSRAWNVARRFVPAGGLVLLWGGVSLLLALWFSGRIRDWSVMTDELQYAKIATAISEPGLPSIHGSRVSVFDQLYPLLIAPAYGALSAPTAFRAAHVLNAFVMVSAVFPAYLVARQVLPRIWSFAVAALSVFVPWIVLAGFLMTEVAAYPAFLWAILGLQVAIAAPSPRHDLLAAAALGVAVFARTQFAVLALVLPLAVLGHELGLALAEPGPASTSAKLRAGARRAVAHHRLLFALYMLGGLAVGIVALVGSAGSLLGRYSVTVGRGSILPAEMWGAALRHLDAVAIGSGLAPFLLGGGWMLAATARSRDRTERALATLSLVTVVLLTLEVASYNVRFGGADVVRDRYLFYVVPLLLVGSAAALRGASRWHIAVGALLMTALFASTVSGLDFATVPGISVDSPPKVLNDILSDHSGGLATGTFVAVVGLLLGLALTLAVLFAPRAPVAVLLFAGLLAFSTLTVRSEVDRVVTGDGLTGRPLAGPPGRVLDWVDRVLPKDARVAIVPFPLSTAWDTSAVSWWDLEFWNRSITETYVAADGHFTYTPFPSRPLAIEWATGEVAGTKEAPAFVISVPHDPRFLLAGSPHAANLGFIVTAVERPYRVVWASRGLQTDGWTHPGRPATIRVYGTRNGNAELVYVRVSLQGPSGASARYRLSTAAEQRVDSLAPSAARQEEVSLCIGGGSAADVTIVARSSARVEGPPLGPDARPARRVGVGITSVFVLPTRLACRPLPV